MSPTTEPKIKTSAGLETATETANRVRAATRPLATPALKVPDAGVITTDTLATPTPMAIPTPAVDTATPVIASQVESAQAQTDTFLQDLTTSRQSAETNKQTSLQSYIDSLMAPGEIARTAEAYAQKGGVDEIQRELDTINNKILTEQKTLRRQIDNITRQGGQSKGQAQSQINNLERESLAKQADLSVIQMGVQGRFDSAKTIADRAVAAEVEVQTQRQNVLSTIYQDNKDLFSKAEQREFETKQADRDRKIQEEADNKKAKYDLAIQAQMDGAPTAVVEQMLAAKTQEEALAIGGAYIGALDREAKRANIAQGWANLDLRQQEVNLSRERLNAELNANGNQYGTLDGKPQTGTQALVNGYANRLLEADKIIDTVGDLFTGRSASIGALVPSMFQPAERQQFEQAKRNYINAVLRRESGAVISPEEFKNADKQYFPQPGDTPEVLAQKADNRNTVTNNFYAEANVPRPTFPGDIIESGGKKYRVESDGVTITEI